MLGCTERRDAYGANAQRNRATTTASNAVALRSVTRDAPSVCRDCGEPLHEMGRSFKTPRKDDNEQWEKVRALWKADFGSGATAVRRALNRCRNGCATLIPSFAAIQRTRFVSKTDKNQSRAVANAAALENMGYDKKIHNVLVLADCAPVALADKEVWEWQQRWRQVYASELRAETRHWTYKRYDWHVFSFAKHPSKQGDGAWSEYRRLEACSFLVLGSDIKHTFGFSCTGKPPERLDRGVDIVVAPPSMEWTMAFNHEHYGPYFAVP